MYKILVGIPAMFPPKELVNDKGLIIDKEIDDDAEEWCDVWCDFELSYYPDKKYYQFGFETMLGFNEKDGARNWIIKCLNVLTDYMNEHGYDTSKELDMHEVFTYGYSVNTEFEDIETAYAWLKSMVFGFHGKGLWD